MPLPLLSFAGMPDWLIPLVIFSSRVVDVSIGTLRIILVGRGMRALASALGFFEILIWLLAISQIIQNLTSIEMYIAYAAGFAVGTFVGMTIERALSMGTLMVRIITPRDSADLVFYLIAQDYRITHLDGHGALGPVKVIFTVVPRKSLGELLAIIKKFDPGAFYSVEDIRAASDSSTPSSGQLFKKDLIWPLYLFRTTK